MKEDELPDLISTSGRETLPLEERLILIYNDVLWLQCQQRTGAEVHDANVLIGWCQATAKRAASESPSLLKAMTTMKALPIVECRLLAWRRGGHQEEQRVCREQTARSRRGE